MCNYFFLSFLWIPCLPLGLAEHDEEGFGGPKTLAAKRKSHLPGNPAAGGGNGQAGSRAPLLVDADSDEDSEDYDLSTSEPDVESARVGMTIHPLAFVPLHMT